VLDTSFDEDRARNRCDHGPENLAILRKLAPQPPALLTARYLDPSKAKTLRPVR
jgi:hypothetical protein